MGRHYGGDKIDYKKGVRYLKIAAENGHNWAWQELGSYCRDHGEMALYWQATLKYAKHAQNSSLFGRIAETYETGVYKYSTGPVSYGYYNVGINTEKAKEYRLLADKTRDPQMDALIKQLYPSLNK